MMTDIVYWSSATIFPILSTLTVLPFVTLAALALAQRQYFLHLALSGAFLNVLLSLYLLHIFDSEAPGIHLAESLDI
jgi:NADH-quinone oxidoreductase subunit M